MGEALRCDKTSALPCSVELEHSRQCERHVKFPNRFPISSKRMKAEKALAAAEGMHYDPATGRMMPLEDARELGIITPQAAAVGLAGRAPHALPAAPAPGFGNLLADALPAPATSRETWRRAAALELYIASLSLPSPLSPLEAVAAVDDLLTALEAPAPAAAEVVTP